MDPILTILLTSSTVSLSTILKEKQSKTQVEKVGEKFLAKIKSKMINKLKVDEFKDLVVEIIQETNEYSDEEASQISENVVTEVITELKKYGNDITILARRIDVKFADILENADYNLAKQFLDLKNELNRFVYLAKDQSQTLLKFLHEFQDDQSKEYGNFLEQCMAICNEYGNYNPNSDETYNFVYNKLSYDFFQLKENDEIVVEKKGTDVKMTGKTLTDELKFKQFFIKHEGTDVNILWLHTPKILTEAFSVQTMIEVSNNFVELLDSFQDKNKRFQFLHELMNLFYRLTEKNPDSMVALSNVMDYEYKFDDLSGLEFENTIIGFLYLLKMRNIELPTPFYYKLKSFEVKNNLMERLGNS